MSHRFRVVAVSVALFVGGPALAVVYVYFVRAGSWTVLLDEFGVAILGGFTAGVAADAYFVFTHNVKTSEGKGSQRRRSASPWRWLPIVVGASLLVPVAFSSDPRLLIVMFAASFVFAVAPLAIYGVFASERGK